MTEHPSTPDAEPQVAESATATPAPEAESAPKATAEPTPAESAEGKPEEAPAAEAATEPASEPAAPASPAEARADRKRRWVSLAMDATLVLLLVAVLGTAVYYFRATAERYHVPTPMELLLVESERLDQRYYELLPKANQADTQLHMRARLAQLEQQQSKLSADIAEKKASLDAHHGQVLAMQYAIRQADETNRGIARSLLPGMPVGNVTTTTGKAYRNATIYRLDKRYIYIRFPEGQVRFPLRHLVKDNLPDLARYAFGELDLVDMSDFEQTGDAPAPQRRRPAIRPAQENAGYDPAPGSPVLDADANRTTTTRVPNEEHSEPDTWEAPTGDLPM